MHIINILINIFMIASLVITGQGSRDILGPPTSEGTPQINESVDRDVFDPPTSTGAPRVVESVKRSVLVEPISAGMSPISTIPSRGSSIAYYTPSWYFPGYGEPIKIRREITPESLRKDYIMGDKLWVTAEVINIKNDMANRYLKNIYIREIIDNDLQVIVPESEGNINKEPLIDFAMTNSFKDISYNELKLFRGESLNYNIKAIRIQDDGIYKDAVICSNETFLRYLFEWRSVLLNEGTERKKMKNYLSETFGLVHHNTNFKFYNLPII